MPSRFIKTLRKQSGLIERTFINFPYSPAGNYSDPQLLNASSYILLIHAEIESYIEARVEEHIQFAQRLWLTNRKPTRSLAAFCVYFSGTPVLPTEHDPQKDEYGAIVVKAIRSATSKLGSNHGIREKNVMQLLQMIGYDVQTIDPLLIAELETIGSLRGEHAHKSSAYHLATRFDPFDVTKKIARLIQLLEIFDTQFSLFKKKQFGR